jgi:hypothetical protein
MKSRLAKSFMVNSLKNLKLASKFSFLKTTSRGGLLITANSLLSKSPMYYFSDLPAHEMIAMPMLSPTMESGKIVSWNF